MMKNKKNCASTHEVVYYTVEDESGFIIFEGDDADEVRSWIKDNLSEDELSGLSICGFRQTRDDDEDVLSEEVVYEEPLSTEIKCR